ncbi:hypothetical protein QTP86_006848 [Hemibagrus guttatus]|nr:hypothetical protein QTP86_006848 [Hemibagrus guttatus]
MASGSSSRTVRGGEQEEEEDFVDRARRYLRAWRSTGARAVGAGAGACLRRRSGGGARVGGMLAVSVLLLLLHGALADPGFNPTGTSSFTGTSTVTTGVVKFPVRRNVYDVWKESPVSLQCQCCVSVFVCVCVCVYDVWKESPVSVLCISVESPVVCCVLVLCVCVYDVWKESPVRVEGVSSVSVVYQCCQCCVSESPDSESCRRKPLLKMMHKKARKQFAEDKQTKVMDYWNHVLWSDETKHGGGSVMVWGCMSAAGTGELQFIEGTVNANMHCDILKQSTSPSLWRLGHRAVFQHDNDPKHTSKATTALLKKLRVKVMACIEHLWGILKRKVEERKVSNIHQLRDVIMEEWKRIPGATCEALVNSMPRGLNH